jgi:hypothetical protein
MAGRSSLTGPLVLSNDEIARRGIALTTNEADLSQPSTHSDFSRWIADNKLLSSLGLLDRADGQEPGSCSGIADDVKCASDGGD